MQSEVGRGLNREDRIRAEMFLMKFIKHVKPGKLAICGGLATRFHLKERKIDFPERPFNDLDLLIEKPDDIESSIISDFMLYHYHPPGIDDPVEPTYFFYAFVDTTTHIKTDVFPYRWSSTERFVRARLKEKLIDVVGVEDQLIQCLYDVSRISPSLKVDPKQLDDVHILMKIADRNLVRKLWIENNHPSYSPTFDEALRRAENIRKDHPDWWQAKPYRKPKPYICSHCKSRPNYLITKMSEIYKTLGYVE